MVLWDTWLAAALATRAGLGSTSLHRSGVEMVCRLTPLTDQYDLIKAAYAMELLTRPSELRSHYGLLSKPTITTIDDFTSD